MVGDDDLNGLISQLYDAAYDPSLWRTVLARISDYVAVRGTQFLLWDKASNSLAFTAMSGFSIEAQRLYGAHYGAMDPDWHLLYQRPIGTPVRCDEYSDDNFVRKSEFYNDFLIPAGGRYRITSRLADDNQIIAVVGIHKDIRHGPFGANETKKITRLMPHLMKAAQFTRRFMQLHEVNKNLEAALDYIGSGIIVADGDCCILLANAAAEDLLNAGDGLCIRNGRLTASRSEDADTLRNLVNRSATTVVECDRHPDGALKIERSPGHPPLSVLIGPFARQPSEMLASCAHTAIIFVTDPERTKQTPIAVLRSLYGLTPAEARVAAAIEAGLSIADIAEAHHTSRNTVRVQVQFVLQKTGTARQAELVSLMSRLPTTRRNLDKRR